MWKCQKCREENEDTFDSCSNCGKSHVGSQSIDIEAFESSKEDTAMTDSSNFDHPECKTFNIYEHPTQGYEAVKAGFSWPAFIFNFFWLLFKKLWVQAGLWLVAYFVCDYIETAILESVLSSGIKFVVLIVTLAIWIALALLPGLKGNKWREENLVKRGYELAKILQAQTPEAAIAKHARSI